MTFKDFRIKLFERDKNRKMEEKECERKIERKGEREGEEWERRREQ